MKTKVDPKIEKFPQNIELTEHQELAGIKPQGETSQKAAIDPKELLKRIVYKPSALVWKNFNAEQPQIDRWILIWCNMGRIAPNLYLSYRDSQGNYDLPHPTKPYPAQAWAYVDVPEMDQEELKKAQAELEEQAKKSAVEPAKKQK